MRHQATFCHQALFSAWRSVWARGVAGISLLFASALIQAQPQHTAGTAVQSPTDRARHACLIEPTQRVELRSSVEGRILSISVDRGALVQRGQVLVELESGAERAALDAARYRSIMEGNLQSANSRRDAAQVKLRRRDELVKEKFIAEQDRDDSLAELRQAEASIVEAQDNRRLAELEQRRLQELIEQRRIRSPITGVVTDRLQHPGEIVQAGESSRAILKLAQINPLRVDVVLPVGLFGQIRAGMQASVQIEAPLSGTYRATVQVVDRLVDSASGTFRARLDLPNPQGTVPAGVKCSLQF